ncbi:hypothetical protein NicSoilC5_16550 [Arthrobacter sp. NicSoilC5]|nr:hypothetical protein NicSoilC5_16550 [Arthrobacter sp. NicSoilC5]
MDNPEAGRLMARNSEAWGWLLVLAALSSALTLAGCAQTETTVDSKPQAVATKGQGRASSPSCTSTGNYKVVPSANGSFPLLPATSTAEPPLVRLSSTHLKNDPVTADLSVALLSGGSPASREFRGLALGQQASFDGYTVRITSICEGEVRFDLVQQPG